MGAKTSISDHLGEKRRLKTLGSVFRAGWNAWTPKAASYRMALPFQAGKRSVFPLRRGALAGRNYGDFVSDGWV
jgi:hypothetical protein